MAIPLAAIAGLSAAGGALSSILGSSAAASAQKKALKYVKQQTKMARGDVAPYLGIGTEAVPAYMDAIGLGNSDAAVSTWQNSPLYKILYGDALAEGRDDVLSTTSSRRMLNSGATLKALQDRRMREANKFFGEYRGDLRDAVGRGQNAAVTSANIATGAGSQMAELQGRIGDSQLAGFLGVGNSLQSGGSDLLSILGQKRGMSLYGGASSPDFARIY